MVFPSNGWIVALGVLFGAIYAWVLYGKKYNWSKTTNLILALTRGLLVLLLFVLLASPLLKLWQQHIQKPIYAILIDNSTSIYAGEDSVQVKTYLKKIEEVKNTLEKSEMEVVIKTLDDNINLLKDVKFTNQTTNLSKSIKKIEDEFEGEHLAAITILSDGIYNQGTAPTFETFHTPLYTIGLGDTVPKKDISLKSINYNKIAFAGNKFPIVCEIKQKGFESTTLTVVLKEKGNIISKKTLNTNKSEFLEVSFEHSQPLKGTYHYQIEIVPTKGEYTLKNNYAHAYISVVDTKEKILILASAPHPDIKAIKSALETNDQVEVNTIIPGITSAKFDNDYNVAVLVQLPHRQGLCNEFLTKLYQSNCALFYVIGGGTDLNQFNQTENILKIIPQGNEKDLVGGAFNTSFTNFKINETSIDLLAKLPPLQVPFARYNTVGNTQTLLYQRVGNILTDKPLLMVGTQNSKKIGVLTGEGIWQWRLSEYQETNQNVVFDEIINKTIQYLSTKEDQRKFKVYPINKEIFTNERLVFENEIYNDIYERIFDQEIKLSVTTESGKTYSYQYITNKENTNFDVGNFEPGMYKYVAEGVRAGKKEKYEGYFNVKELEIEALNTTADHSMLRELSLKNQGKYFSTNNIDKLTNELLSKKIKSKVLSTEESLEIINIRWLFFIFLFLISLEWIIRKYNGAY